jgi:hypothetical protein
MKYRAYRLMCCLTCAADIELWANTRKEVAKVSMRSWIMSECERPMWSSIFQIIATNVSSIVGGLLHRQLHKMHSILNRKHPTTGMAKKTPIRRLCRKVSEALGLLDLPAPSSCRPCLCEELGNVKYGVLTRIDRRRLEFDTRKMGVAFRDRWGFKTEDGMQKQAK